MTDCPTAPEARQPLFHGPAAVLVNRPIARNTFLIRLDAPLLAKAIRPGQFMMVRLPGGTDPLLGRPFALYDTQCDAHGEPLAVDVVYLVVGKLTGLLSHLRTGDAVEVWGPLGNGFPDLSGCPHVGMVAGGIGQTPFLAHVRDLLGTRGFGGTAAKLQCGKVSLFYGVRSAGLAAGVDDFVAAGAAVHLATDDGSMGHHGYVTDLLAANLDGDNDGPRQVIGCGPEPMLRSLAALCHKRGLPCHVSLETPMACGIGICFSCVTRVRTPQVEDEGEGEGWDYRRVCVEGPVFDAAHVIW